MKNPIERLVTIVVGVAVLFFAYQFWFGSGILNGWFSPNVETGKLGAGTADFFSQVLEIILTLVSTVGITAIAIALKLIRFITNAIQGTANEFARKPPETVTVQQGDPRVTNIVVDNRESKPQHITPQQQADYVRVLIQAVVEGDRNLMFAMAERINGTPFLTPREVEVDAETTPSGFPKGGAK